MKYIRLIETMNSQDLTMIKLALSKENIAYKTLFENTLRIADVYALGNSGAIIEVAEDDYLKSKEILSELGFNIDYDPIEDRFEFVNKFDRITENIPFLRRFRLEYRFLLILLVSSLMLGSIVLINALRISINELVGHFWCVEEIIHNGEKLQPNTKSGVVIIGLQEKCKEDILFHKTGMISLPGFDTNNIKGRWNFKTRNSIEISRLSEFGNIYEGEYQIHTKLNGRMNFVSNKTTITISRDY